MQFIGASQKVPAFCVVTEYLGGGTLRAHLQAVAPRRLPLRQALQMALDIARGMEYLHSQVSGRTACLLPEADVSPVTLRLGARTAM